MAKSSGSNIRIMVSVKIGASQQVVRSVGFADQGPEPSITTTITPNEIDGRELADKNQTNQNSNAPDQSGDLSMSRMYGNDITKQVETDSQQDDSEQDELILRRLLASRRSSEGCALKYSANQFLSRRNSGGFASLNQTFDDLLPTVTEGQTMDHEAFCCGSKRTGDDASSGLSSAASSIGNQYLCSIMDRVNSRYLSKDDITSSSFSSSLDKMDSSSSSSAHYRRRSSTVSQCSSVLSETSRAQLNFDLSPDLPIDSTIIQANMLDVYPRSNSQQLMKRPQTPEPYSGADSSDSSVDEIPLAIPMASKARLFTPEIMLMDQVAMGYGGVSGSEDSDEVSRCLNGIISRQSGEEGSMELSGSLGDSSVTSGSSLDYSATLASDNRLILDQNDPMSRLVSSIESMSGQIRTRTMSESPSEIIITKS